MLNRSIVIVLGSSGFVGSTICKLLIEGNTDVIGIDTVISAQNKLYKFYQSGINQELLSSILQEEQVAVIVNAAGKASVKDSFETPFDDFNHNTVLTYLVLDAIRKHSPNTKLIFLSSAAVYGNPEKLPITETDPLNPISPYGFHKMQSEMIAREFYTCFNISTVVLRIFSCYGAGQRKLFLWDLCNKTLADEKILLKGCGNETRDFVHVSDVAACIQFLVEKDITGFEIFNLASGKEYSIRDTAVMLADKMGEGKEISFEGKKNTGNPDNWMADISKIRNNGFEPAVLFEDGIKAYVDWFKSL
jgi:UDP-glucose 4-epimerase